MNDIFIKKYWPEENRWFYLHFKDGQAVRQVEVSEAEKIFLSLEHPTSNKSFLFDQNIQALEFTDSDTINAAEFDEIWGQKHTN